MDQKTLPGYNHIVAAAQRIEGMAFRTPLLKNVALDEAVGGDVWIKPECLQRTGSFKFRGAFNTLAKLNYDEMARGVVAFSSGNHAQGVAEAAKMLGIKAQIVMPIDAPKVKIDGVTNRGAEIIFYDRETEDRDAIGRQLAEEQNCVLVPSFDHPDVIAGQGTCGLEIIEDLIADDIKADQVLCCVGGGGLIAGIGLAFKERMPDTDIWGVEPEGFDDHRLSLEAGHRVPSPRRSGSICDAIITPGPGEMTFALNQHQLSGVAAISDEDALNAVRFAALTLKLTVEPGGAAALAALLSGNIKGEGRMTVVVLTGGNIDPKLLARTVAD